VATGNAFSPFTAISGIFDKSDPIHWPLKKRIGYGWIITFTLFFFMMLNWADKAVLGLAAVPIMKELGIGPEVFGLVSSAMFFTFGLSQIAVAPLMDRLSSKWLLFALCLLWSVAQAPIIFFASLPALWVGRLILGIGEGPSSPAILHGIYKWFPEEKRAAPGAFASVGAMVGLVIFAPALAWTIGQFGWISAFVMLAIAGVILAIAWLVIGKEGPLDRRDFPAGKHKKPDTFQLTSPTTEIKEPTVPLWRTLISPSWLFTLLTSFCAYWTFTVAMSWAPAYFETVLHIPGPQAGSLIGLVAAWGVVAMLGLSGVSQLLQRRGTPTRRSRAWVLGVGAVVTGGSLLAGLFTETPWIAVALMAVGFGTAPALFPLALLICTELASSSKRGANLALANAAQTSAGVLAPAVSGFIIGGATTSAVGYTTAFAVAASLTLMFGLLCFFCVNQQRDRRRLGLTTDGSTTSLNNTDGPSGSAALPQH
jgi:ACS family D-galactonate transporter-like MFS transporter